MTKLGWVETALGLAASVLGFVGLAYLLFFIFGFAPAVLVVGPLLAVPIGGIGAGAYLHGRQGVAEGLTWLTASSMLLFAGSVLAIFSIGLPLIPASLTGMVATLTGLLNAVIGPRPREARG